MRRLNRKEPPLAHAKDHWDPETRTLKYKYNGRAVIEIHIPGKANIRWRVDSDGEMCSIPFIQQIYLTVLDEKSVPSTCKFTMTEEAVCMRARRARSEEAILGQVGHPLIEGVPGLYDILDDYLIDWHGRDWSWAHDKMEVNEDGTLSATINIDLGFKAWIINLRPQYYRKHLGYSYHEPWKARPNLRPITGWCSWEAYRRKISEENLLEAADFLAKNFKEYGFEFVQMDDGYQVMPVSITKDSPLVDSWLKPNEKFPSGLEGMVEGIKERGLSPAIWVNTDMREYDPPEGEPNCILQDENGDLLKAAFMGFPFDCTDENIKKHMVPIYEGLKKMGFPYIKVDALRHTLHDALHEMVRRELLTNEEAEKRFRSLLAHCREAMGDDTFYLASWGVFTEVCGLVDACRVATDSNPAWRKLRMQIVESDRWWHSQRILFLNDPDHICARTKPEWGMSILSLVSLTGGLFMLSDPIELYDEQRIRNIRKTIPPLTTVAAETGPMDIHYQAYAWTKMHGVAFTGEIEYDWKEVNDEDALIISGDHESMEDDHPHGSLWAHHMCTDIGCWCVMQRIANLPMRASTVKMEKLALSPTKTYAAFDFWAEKYLGEVTGQIDLPALPLGFCQVIAFREVLDHPQLLATTRHVSMGAISVKKQTWQDGTLKLDLECPAGSTETYWFHCPKGWKFDTVEANGAAVAEKEKSGEAVELALTFKSRNASLTTKWVKE